ncbi:unnamed protein product [Ilex paraguariensis]|uniref:Uncharacterized protein n=1 Tax=Ilex paraguariensis TaxID=185542 RepID=A0ABC8TYP5_9AQUA
MAASSIDTFRLYFRTELQNPKILKHTAHTSLKPPSITPAHIHKSLSLQPKTQTITKISISPEPSFLSRPNSSNSFSNCSLLTHEKISKFFAEKVVVVLVGSFIFMGCLTAKPRPVVALPGQESSYGGSMEHKRETQDGKSEDEKIYVNLLEENPRNVEALKVVVNEKMRRGKTKEAVEYVERLIDVEPKEVEWRLLQALCYEMMGQLSKAKRLFKEILKQRPLLLRALHVWFLILYYSAEF